MRKRSRKPESEDANQLAKSIVAGPTEQDDSKAPPKKNPAAVALGRQWRLKGGPARAKKLSKERRREIAKKAATAGWRRKRQESS